MRRGGKSEDPRQSGGIYWCGAPNFSFIRYNSIIPISPERITMTRAKRSKATGKRKHEEVEAKPKPQVAKGNREEVVKNEKPKEDGEVKEDGAKVEAESELKEQDGTFYPLHSSIRPIFPPSKSGKFDRQAQNPNHPPRSPRPSLTRNPNLPNPAPPPP